MIPQDPVGSSSAFQTLYKNLYSQLGPDYKICQYLSAELIQTKNLLWIQYKQQSVFIFISDQSESSLGLDSIAVDQQNQHSLREVLLNNPEIQTVIKFKKSLLPEKGRAFHNQLIPVIVIYQQIPNSKLNLKLASHGLSLLGNEYINSENLKNLLELLMGLKTSKKIHEHIRQTFNSETKLSGISSNKNNKSCLLLDNEQEIALKTDLSLVEEDSQTVNCNLAGVNGGSHSGKSEIILQRAKLLHALDPQQTILILCANERSQNNLIKRYQQLTNDNNANDKIYSLNNWCAQQLNDKVKTIGIRQAQKAIKKASDYFLDQNESSLQVFMQELDYIQKHTIIDEKEYSKRRPATMLNGETHNSIWKALQTLNKKLAAEKYVMRNDLPKILWQTVKTKSNPGKYDHILVDDAHQFSPLAFEIIRKYLKPKTGQLYISQDPRQGINNPISLWKDTGLDLRGKSTRLLNNYQINPYILNAANAYYMQRLPDDTDKVIQFNFNQNQEFKKPTLLHFNSERDEDNRLLNEIRVLVTQEVSLDKILIITSDPRSSDHCAELISHMLKLPFQKINRSVTTDDQAIKICEIENCMGLKSPYVFIFGLQKLSSQESEEAQETNHLDIETFEAASYIANTRKLNSAMVCAQKELTLFMTSDIIPEEFLSPHIHIPTIDKSTKAKVSSIQA